MEVLEGSFQIITEDNIMNGIENDTPREDILPNHILPHIFYCFRHGTTE